MTDASSDPVSLAIALDAARSKLAAAKHDVESAERALVAVLGFRKPEGQHTYNLSTRAGIATVTAKQPVSLKFDSDAWPEVRKSLPRDHPARRVVVNSYGLDKRAAKKLQDEDPEAFRAIARLVTRKPGKVAVDVKDVVAGAVVPHLSNDASDWRFQAIEPPQEQD